MIGSSRGLPPMLAFLFELAWASRIRLPLLIAAAFMVTNVNMRLEININFEMEEQIVLQDDDDVAENSSNEEENEGEEEESSDSQYLFQTEHHSEDLSSEDENDADADADAENAVRRLCEEKGPYQNDMHSSIDKWNRSNEIEESANIQDRPTLTTISEPEA